MSTERERQLEARVAELEQQLDHERLFPAHWANRRIRDAFGDVVRSGPFTGLCYPDWAMTTIDVYSNKVLGSYELELHDALEQLIAAQPSTVINLGLADGYYAIGLALRLPQASVIGYEIEEWRVAQLRPIAEHNGVDIEVHIQAATPADLQAMTGPDTLIICDIEGGEADLLDPVAAPALRSASILVETHDHRVPGVSDRLRAAFAPTHDIVQIDARPRYAEDFPETDFLPLVTRHLAVVELRGGPQSWLVLTPRG